MAGEIETLLEQYGYQYTGTCQCDGYHTIKYRRKDGYEVKWRKKRYMFKLKKNNELIKSWSPVSILSVALSETHPLESVHT